MNNISRLVFCALLALTCCVGFSTKIHAQSAQVFVSAPNGNDSGSCTSDAPCRTVNFALTQVQANGQVLIVDSGSYDSSVSITKDVTIAAAPGVAAVFSNAVNFGSIITFNYPASFCTSSGECRILTLRNLIFDGQGVTQDALRPAGIRLLVENCTFTRLRFGVFVNGGGTYQFKNCVFQSLETGLYFAPNNSTRTVLAVVEDCRFASLTGMGIDLSTGPQGNNTLRATVRDSLFNRANVGLRAISNTGGSIQADVERCEITNNATGLLSTFAASTIRVSNSTIVGNTTGVSAANGGTLLSRLNNTVEGNTTNGNFTGAFAAK